MEAGVQLGRLSKIGFDFSAARVRLSVDESLSRLGVGRLDLVQVHDVEFGDLDQIVGETLPALARLRDAGKIQYVGITGYPLTVLEEVADRAGPELLDTVLSYCHFTVLDQSLADHRDFFWRRGITVLNASPLAMGALTDRGAPGWHPAPRELLERCARAADLCRARGACLERVALQFAIGETPVATTFVGMSGEDEVRRNLDWLAEPLDRVLLGEIQAILEPVRGYCWPSGRRP